MSGSSASCSLANEKLIEDTLMKGANGMEYNFKGIL